VALTVTQDRAGVDVLRLLAAPFVAFGNLMISIAEANTRVKKFEYFNSMSDAELAERGMKREDIVRHVFPDYLGV
jgi:hypothetical protein